jgi:hypothetical protein
MVMVSSSRWGSILRITACVAAEKGVGDGDPGDADADDEDGGDTPDALDKFIIFDKHKN